MELTTKTAKELQKLKDMLKEEHSVFSNSIIQDNINQIINFKNELKEKFDIVTTPHGTFKSSVNANFVNGQEI